MVDLYRQHDRHSLRWVMLKLSISIASCWTLRLFVYEQSISQYTDTEHP